MKYVIILLLLLVSFDGRAAALETAMLELFLKSAGEQIQLLKALVENGKDDQKSLREAHEILMRLSEGIDKTLEPYRASEEYQKAIAALQAVKSQKPAQPVPFDYLGLTEIEQQAWEEDTAYNTDFEKYVTSANIADLQDKEALEKILQDAPPGFVPKLNAEANAKAWESNVRLSMQLTELLRDVRRITDEMKRKRLIEKRQRAEELKALKDSFELPTPVRPTRKANND